jgi:magnesium transporter
MLEVYPKRGDCRVSAAELAAEGLDHHTWIDLQQPSPDEVAEVERLLGLKVPTREALEEIELSSRLRVEGEALVMSTPLLARGEDGTPVSAPTGFVLTERMCLTVRFAASAVFDTVKSELQQVDRALAPDIFVRLLEEVVDRAADHFEVAADQLDKASHAIFHLDQGKDGRRRQRLSKDTELLRQVMTEIGRASERISRVRYTLVCVTRMAQFVTDRAKPWLPAALPDRLGSVRADIASLEQFEENLLSRVQLLQDAATAFISIEQNDVVKVLTIASAVGIPPVFIVGVYGMNFKYMPELNWTWGYPFAWALIVVSTLASLAWFKWKDWM